MKTRISNRAFTLLEVMLSAALIIALMWALIQPLQWVLDTLKLQQEKTKHEALAAQIEESFSSLDPTMNLSVTVNNPWGGAATYNTLSSTDIQTADSTTLGAMLTNQSVYVTTYRWYAKLAAFRALPVTNGVTYTATNDNDIRQIVMNGFGTQRLFLRGPSESGLQRYILISVTVPPSRGVVWPTDDGTANYFNEIWQNSWGSESTTAPAGWSARLTAAQVTQWNQAVKGKTNAGRVLVTKFVQRKYALTINNNHASYSAWADWDGVTSRVTAAPASGVTVSPEILAGHEVVIRQGLTAPGAEAMRFRMREATAITIQ